MCGNMSQIMQLPMFSCTQFLKPNGLWRLHPNLFSDRFSYCRILELSAWLELVLGCLVLGIHLCWVGTCSAWPYKSRHMVGLGLHCLTLALVNISERKSVKYVCQSAQHNDWKVIYLRMMTQLGRSPGMDLIFRDQRSSRSMKKPILVLRTLWSLTLKQFNE